MSHAHDGIAIQSCFVLTKKHQYFYFSHSFSYFSLFKLQLFEYRISVVAMYKAAHI